MALKLVVSGGRRLVAARNWLKTRYPAAEDINFVVGTKVLLPEIQELNMPGVSSWWWTDAVVVVLVWRTKFFFLNYVMQDTV